MRNILTAAVAALALILVCSCAEPDEPEKARTASQIASESESSSFALDAGDASLIEERSGEKSTAQDAEGTDSDSEDERTVDGDEMTAEATGEDSVEPGESDTQSRGSIARAGGTTRAGVTKRTEGTTKAGGTTKTGGTTKAGGTTRASGSSTSKTPSQTTRTLSTSARSAETTKAPETPVQEPIPAQPAPSYPLKSGKSAPANANDHNVPASQIYEGAGPLGSANVYVGSNDFMFYGDCITDLTGTNLFSDGHLSRFAGIMNERDSWAKQNGMDLILVIAPNKATVYNDYVPSSVKQSGYTRCDQVVEYLRAHTGVKVIDLRKTLKDARSTYGDELYYRYDTHWNQNAGFVAYGAIMSEIKKAHPTAVRYGYNDFNVNWYETYMKDLTWYLGWYDTYYDNGPVFSLKAGPAAKLVAKERNGSVGGQYQLAYQWPDGYRDDLTYLYYKSKNTSASSVYVYQDSFGIALMPFMKESFSESFFEWSYKLSKRDILEMEPDTIIIEVNEKELGDFVKLRAFY